MSTAVNSKEGNQPPHSFSINRIIPLQYKPLIFGIITFIVLGGLIGFLAFQRFLINKENVQQETYDVVLATKERMQETLAQGIAATQTLSLFIGQDGTVKDFDSIAKQILAVNNAIDVLQLVPGGEIKYVYPLKGNEQVIGYNILNDPQTKKEAYKAIQRKELFYAGPLQLKQGGIGIVGRLPIFRNNTFWGFSAVIIRLPALLKAAGIDSLSNKGYYFQLSKINPVTNQEEFFVSLPPRVVVAGSFVNLEMHEEEWKLSATPVNAKKGYTNVLWLVAVGTLFAILGGVFVYTVVKKPEKLDQLVKLRTAALKDSEQNYRTLIEQASDAVIVYSLDGTIHQFNKAAHIESGYSREEFSTLNLTAILPEKKVVINESRIADLKAGKNVNFERQLVKKDGQVCDIEINANLLPNGQVLAFVRNITKRRITERALKESEEKFSKAFQSNLLAFAIVNSEFKVVDTNELFAAILETTRDNIIGKNVEDAQLLHRIEFNNSNEIKTSIQQTVLAGEGLKNFELTIRSSDQHNKYLLLNIESLEISKQRNWLITAIDITRKKNAELSLVQNELKYRSLIEQASDGIIITDLNGIITEVNRSICEMGNYKVEELVGFHVEDFLPQEDLEDLPLRIDELKMGKALLYERRMLRKDGTAIAVEVNSKMASGQSLIGFVRDITERKNASEALKKSTERFELIAMATHDAIWDHSFITNETVGNKNFYDLYDFGENKPYINFELFQSRVHPADLDPIIKNMEHAFKTKAHSITEEFRFRLPDGSYKHFYDRVFITYNEQDRPLRILGVMQDITRRIKDEQQLLKEKELSDSIINSLPAVFYLYNEKGEFLRWNKNFEKVTGYNSDEISRIHPLDLFDEDEKRILDKKIKNVFLTGKDSVEANFLLKNKQKIPYYFSGMKIKYEGQTCLMGFGLDFSDKVQSDRLIKESEEKFRSLVEQAADGVAIVAAEGNMLYVSPSVERILGYTEAACLKLNIFGITHPDDWAEVEKIFDQAMQQPGVPLKGFTSRVLHKDGSWRCLEATVTNMLHIPSIRGIVENFRDVTEKLEIEKKIINEKELSDSIINSLPGIFYLYDKAGKFIRWNKNFEMVTGYQPAEIRQMHPMDFYAEPDRLLVKKRMETIFSKQLPQVELRLLTKDNTIIPFYINSLATEYEGVPCIMGMGFDVTERKKIEKELLISNQQLAQKANELKNSYTELERFAYIVSHDLQEPLRMVASFLKLLKQKYQYQLDETGDKYIHFAVDGADRMKQLIMDLLEYSRTGTNKEIAAETDMNEVIQEVLKVLDTSIQEQGAVLEIGQLPVLPGTSKIQMFQLLQNLLGNALKYHGADKPEIKVGASMVNDEWVFSVKDNGIGIDPKFSNKIFIIFQRLHSKTEFSGTGIGLSICKKIVEKHGGKIWVESTPGKGSTFYFTIKKRITTEPEFIPYG